MLHYRLPRILENDASGERVGAFMAERVRPLVKGGDVGVVPVRCDEVLRTALVTARRQERLVRGFDEVKRTLSDEGRGQALADARSGSRRGVRVSRLLIMTNDGGEGFRRRVARLLQRHGGKVMAIELDIGSAELGAMLYGGGSSVQTMLLKHKDAVVAFLLACAGESGKA